MSVNEQHPISAPVVNVTARIKEAESRGLISMEGLVLHTAFRAINKKRLKDMHASRVAGKGSAEGSWAATDEVFSSASLPSIDVPTLPLLEDIDRGNAGANDSSDVAQSHGAKSAVRTEPASPQDGQSLQPAGTISAPIPLPLDAQTLQLAVTLPAPPLDRCEQPEQLEAASTDGGSADGRSEGMLDWFANGAAAHCNQMASVSAGAPASIALHGDGGNAAGASGALMPHSLMSHALVPLSLEHTLTCMFGEQASPGRSKPWVQIHHPSTHSF